jgi:hypothetical protein
MRVFVSYGDDSEHADRLRNEATSASSISGVSGT